MNDDSRFSTGCLGFSSSNTRLARAINFLTRIRGEAKTRTNHTFGIVRENGMPPLVFEALSKVKLRNFLRAYVFGSSDGLLVFKPINPELATMDKLALSSYWLSKVGKVYGFGKLFLHALDWLPSQVAGKDVIFFRKLGKSSMPICSHYMELGFARIGRHFNGTTGAGSPDSMLDWVEKHPEKWELIYARAGGAMTAEYVETFFVRTGTHEEAPPSQV